MSKKNKFGTFGGVFTPDVLTILGVIMYLRLGWVVGNAGFLGAVAIILLAKSVTLCTGLSMASITTNIRIGAGGAYSIISKSLGLEAGGSIGIPFYIAQTLSAALYIIGFTEGWLLLFPNHVPFAIAVVTWLILLTVSYISAKFAIKIQYVIMGIIALSILSFVLTPAKPVADFVWIGKFEKAGFWQVFAIFFPAVTGIMAGANMSGDLKDPRKSIPVGTLSSILVTLMIYIGLAFMAARVISPLELQNNQMVMVDYALYRPLVILGILAATFSSALGSMVGAPRILAALASQKTVPGYRFLSKKTASNEPRNAIIVTAIMIIVAISLGNLNSLAAIITMFFLITYGTLNVIVFVYQSMRIISFRPTFKVPRLVSFIGALGSFSIMFLLSPVFSFIAITTIIVLYVFLTRQELKSEEGDIRGGIFLMLTEIAYRLTAKFPRHHISWKPDFLIPIDNPKYWKHCLNFIESITNPSGSVFVFTVKERNVEKTERELKELLAPLHAQNILVNSTVIEDKEFLHGAKTVMQTLKAGTLRPNTLFLTLSDTSKNDEVIKQLAEDALKHQLGLTVLYRHSANPFGLSKNVNLWLRDKSPNWHLAMLIALHLQLNWKGKLNILTATPTEDKVKPLYSFLEKLSDQARLPASADLQVLVGNFRETLQAAPAADINIFGLADRLSFETMRTISDTTNSSSLFVRDSGLESALV